MRTHIIWATICVASISASIFLTQRCVNEALASMFIDGYIQEHEFHKKILVDLQNEDTQKAIDKLQKVEIANVEFISTLNEEMRHGYFSYWTKDMVKKNDEWLAKLPNK